MSEARLKVRVDRATGDDLGHAIIALKGIFWALDMLVVEKAADDITTEEDRAEGIASLIAAGELLAKELTERT
ncbi:hypothetical protein [Reyranella sp.]|jgi:hypothetical protein|uniref:hypothetical protein n=1 Tax=Reyranella sp. TaxID=1929291 RepID=UPI000BD7456E|nr:hypothetical protein [Reyranella sp.]OYY46074.1 MAG: hypothetical protein B7Y57_04260 [Rhodospirillales bacterium 35-66-84]OYZ96454.1 MAG: hypothetical protein B7Y08_04620 [Rhodospirillales bacterium 24-66-33]OZB28383.1 MAG: hypothetical protein B7X63_00525 [Rhodospirillales bacterium 39-66-50]HQS14411.1 hypothetical protein [Reyranella sp.]HQT11408.1 hypothetical protein [Reyranella sp.]